MPPLKPQQLFSHQYGHDAWNIGEWGGGDGDDEGSGGEGAASGKSGGERGLNEGGEGDAGEEGSGGCERGGVVGEGGWTSGTASSPPDSSAATHISQFPP